MRSLNELLAVENSIVVIETKSMRQARGKADESQQEYKESKTRINLFFVRIESI
jgi:hypothetical protein